MKNARMLRAIVALSIGVFFTLALLEGTFFFIGRIHPRLVRPTAATGKFNILCLGNSYTAGTGAPSGHAYCDYLQRRLDTHPVYSLYEARVINLGQRSFNSHEVMMMLPREIEKYRPRLVIAMTGEPNYWNRAGLEFFRNGGRPSFFRNPLAALTALARQSGTYRFASLIFGGFSAQITAQPSPTLSGLMENATSLNQEELEWTVFGLLYPSSDIFTDFSRLSEADVDFAIQKLVPLANGPHGTFTVALVVARLYLFGKGNHAEALAWYRRSIAMAPELFRVDAWADLKIILPILTDAERAPFEELRREMATRLPPARELAMALDGENSLRRIKVFPVQKHPTPEHIALNRRALRYRPADWVLTRTLAENYIGSGQPVAGIAAVRELLTQNPLPNPPYVTGFLVWSRKDTQISVDPMALPAIDRLRDDLLARFPSQRIALETVPDHEIDQWVASDLRGIAAITRAAGTTLLLQTYPPLRRPADFRRADAVIREVAEKDQIPLSDTLTFFNRRFEEKERELFYSNDFGPNDSHLNAEGYRELADFLLKSIETYGLLSPEAGMRK